MGDSASGVGRLGGGPKYLPSDTIIVRVTSACPGKKHGPIKSSHPNTNEISFALPDICDPDFSLGNGTKIRVLKAPPLDNTSDVLD